MSGAYNINNLCGKPFKFSDENLERMEQVFKQYPPAYAKKSSLLCALTLAQEQMGWLPREALEYVASFLSLPLMHVYEVATFYTMFNLKPVGRCCINICRTTPCWLRGSDAVERAIEKHLGISVGQTTEDGMFTFGAAECLGACVCAPVLQVGNKYFENVDPEKVGKLLDDVRRDYAD